MRAFGSATGRTELASSFGLVFRISRVQRSCLGERRHPPSSSVPVSHTPPPAVASRNGRSNAPDADGNRNCLSVHAGQCCNGTGFGSAFRHVAIVA